MIDGLVLYNYALPGESLELNNEVYPVDNFTTEVDTRFNEQVKPSEHGIWIRNTFYGKRTFHIEGAILGNDAGEYIDLRRAMLRILTPKSHLMPRQAMGKMDIWFTDMAEQLTCDYTIESYPEIPMEALAPAISRFQLNLKCFDPRLYGLERSGKAFPPSVSGRTYNKTYNKVYTVSSVGPDDVTANNPGDIEVHPVIMFNGPTTGPRAIKIDTDGELHTFELPDLVLGASDIVMADFEKKTIVNTVTGVNVYSFKEGEWWTIEPGVNKLRATAFTPGTGSSTVFKWRGGYLI